MNSLLDFCSLFHPLIVSLFPKVTSTTSRSEPVEIDRIFIEAIEDESTESGIVERSFSSSDSYDNVDNFVPNSEADLEGQGLLHEKDPEEDLLT